MDRSQAETYYEDDEPVEELIAAFEASPKGTTAPSSIAGISLVDHETSPTILNNAVEPAGIVCSDRPSSAQAG